MLSYGCVILRKYRRRSGLVCYSQFCALALLLKKQPWQTFSSAPRRTKTVGDGFFPYCRAVLQAQISLYVVEQQALTSTALLSVYFAHNTNQLAATTATYHDASDWR